MNSDNTQKKPLLTKGTKKFILFLVAIFGLLIMYHVFISPLSVNSANMTISYKNAQANNIEYFSNNSNVQTLPSDNAKDYIVATYKVKVANLGLFNIKNGEMNIKSAPKEFIGVINKNEIYQLTALKNDFVEMKVLVYVGETKPENIGAILKSIGLDFKYNISLLGNRNTSININRTLTVDDKTIVDKKPAQ